MSGNMWTVKECAAFLRYSEYTVYVKAEAGEIPSYKLSNRRLFDPKEINLRLAGKKTVQVV